MTVTRTIELTDIQPTELAEMFCNMDDTEQAVFFEHIGVIAREWPGAGWCQQSYSINKNLTDGGREVIRTLAGHCLEGIAAAPAMLEALDEIVGPMKVDHDNPNIPDDAVLPIDMTMGELRRARAAIANATGAA